MKSIFKQNKMHITLKTTITVILILLITTCGDDGNEQQKNRIYKTVNTAYHPPFAWSPDGTKIVVYRTVVWGFTEETEYGDNALDNGNLGGSRLCVMNADGTDKTDILVTEKAANYFQTIAWSPTNGWIAYSTFDEEIFLIKPDGSNNQKLDIKGFVGTFSPDGSKLVYNSPWSDVNIIIYDLTSNETVIIKTPTDTMYPEIVHYWDSEGYIYYNWDDKVNTSNHREQIRKIKSDGTGDTLVLDGYSYLDICDSIFVGHKPSDWAKVYDFKGNLFYDIHADYNINNSGTKLSPDGTKVLAPHGSYAQTVLFDVGGGNYSIIAKHTIEKIYEDNGESKTVFEAD